MEERDCTGTFASVFKLSDLAEQVYPLLGKRLCIRSNHAQVMATAHTTFAHWQTLPNSTIDLASNLQLSIAVNSSIESSVPKFVHTMQGDEYTGSSGESVLQANMQLGVAHANITPALANNEARLRYDVLENLGLLMCSWQSQNRVAVHASAVLCNRVAVLFVGTSGAGKSTLTYACARAGLPVLAEDVVFVELPQKPSTARLWGHTRAIHLLPNTAIFFNELRNQPTTQRTVGNEKIAVPLAQPIRLFADDWRVCLLARTPKCKPMLNPIQPHQVVAAMADHAEPGFNLNRNLRQAATHLASKPTFQLSISHANAHPLAFNDAVQLLTTTAW